MPGPLIFGGVSWERELANATSATALNCTIGELQNPNQLRFCDRSDLPEGMAIPYAIHGKLSASYPLTVEHRPQRVIPERRRWLAHAQLPDYPRRHPVSGRLPVAVSRRSDRHPDRAVGDRHTDHAALPGRLAGLSGRTVESTRSQGAADLQISRGAFLSGVRGLQRQNSEKIIMYASTNFGPTWSQPNSIVQGRILGVSMKVQW